MRVWGLPCHLEYSGHGQTCECAKDKCHQGSPGTPHTAVASAAAAQGEKILYKPGKGAFYATELSEFLEERGITHLLFAGVTTEVRATVKTARIWPSGHCHCRDLSAVARVAKRTGWPEVRRFCPEHAMPRFMSC